MKPWFVYITTNVTKNVLYTGSTPVLPQRMIEHYLNRGKQKTFAGRYHAYWLVYFETVYGQNNALSGEYQIKGWSKKKKEALISSENPKWNFLNNEIIEEWPPKEGFIRVFK